MLFIARISFKSNIYLVEKSFNNYVNIKEPTAIFSEEYNCINPLSVDFTNISIGADSVFWDFGDGTFSTQTHPTHIFASNGIYDVRLQVQNTSTGCFHEFTKQVKISTPEANFTYLINPNNQLKDFYLFLIHFGSMSHSKENTIFGFPKMV